MATALVKGGASATMGTAVLTDQRLIFFDQRFAANVGIGGVAGAAVAGALQHRHEADGPLFAIDLDQIVGAGQRRKMLNKDRIAITTGAGEVLLNDGWKRFGPALREAIAARGRTVVDDGAEAWRVS
ncbi:MAG: hypothetical protein JWM34_2611 [Ilumatobacteraceae bacterium]|nr:hypothetical protein [Ilumatobacteraceae bacterium]